MTTRQNYSLRAPGVLLAGSDEEGTCFFDDLKFRCFVYFAGGGAVMSLDRCGRVARPTWVCICRSLTVDSSIVFGVLFVGILHQSRSPVRFARRPAASQCQLEVMRSAPVTKEAASRLKHCHPGTKNYGIRVACCRRGR